VVVLRGPVRGKAVQRFRRQGADASGDPLGQRGLALRDRDANSLVLLERKRLNGFEDAVLVNGFDGDGHDQCSSKRNAGIVAGNEIAELHRRGFNRIQNFPIMLRAVARRAAASLSSNGRGSTVRDNPNLTLRV
jgi:hypothetical protein